MAKGGIPQPQSKTRIKHFKEKKEYKIGLTKLGRELIIVRNDKYWEIEERPRNKHDLNLGVKFIVGISNEQLMMLGQLAELFKNESTEPNTENDEV